VNMNLAPSEYFIFLHQVLACQHVFSKSTNRRVFDIAQLYIEMLNPLTLFLYSLPVYFGAVDRYIFPVEHVLSVIGFQ
jgi:hypothetical protein